MTALSMTVLAGIPATAGTEVKAPPGQAPVATAVASPSECDAVPGQLLANCGFETGDLTGWTESADAHYTSVTGSGGFDGVHSGSYSLATGEVLTPVTLSQAVATTPGATYGVRFFVDGGNNDVTGETTFFNATLDNAGSSTLLSLGDVNLGGWTEYSYSFVAEGSSASLAFTAQDVPFYWYLDDASVFLEAPPSAWSATQQPDLSALSPAPSINVNENLAGVSCVSAGDCVAVGHYFTGSGYLPLILTETAGVWGPIQQPSLSGLTPAPSSPPNASLFSVSCASAGNCVAVGSYDDTNGNNDPLILTESAGVWAATQQPALTGLTPAAGIAPSDYLYSVSCASAGNCVAVGFYYDTNINFEPLILTETAGAWSATQQPAISGLTPAPSTAPSEFLNGVSCASAGNCTAVGEYYDTNGHWEALILTETVGAWVATQQPSLSGLSPAPSAVPSVFLSGVSCASAGNCTAVGYYNDTNSSFDPLIMTESAGVWAATQQPDLSGLSPAPGASEYGNLYSVTCTAAGHCTAVGYYVDTNGGHDPLIMTKWAGTWSATQQPGLSGLSPAPNSSADAILNSVSCASAVDCVAVDWYKDVNGNNDPLILTYGPNAKPTITVEPTSQTVTALTTAEFSAAASGFPTPTVQWQQSTDSCETWSDVTGATGTTLSFTAYYSMNGYEYRAVFTNDAGSATSGAASLTVDPLGPSVTTQPNDATVTAGQSASFTAAASGDPTPTLQWWYSTNGGSDWSELAGKTSGTLSFTTSYSMSGYQYEAVFTNVAGPVTSRVATLTVNPSAAIVVGLAASTSKSVITVTWTGGGDPSPTAYQCRVNVKVATWVSCTSPWTIKSPAKTVSVMARNSAGWGSSSTVTVTKK